VNEVSMFPQLRDRADPQAVHQSYSSIPSMGVRFLYSDQSSFHQIGLRHFPEEAQTAVLERHRWSCTGYNGLLSGM
jgi:hypothetical protein